MGSQYIFFNKKNKNKIIFLIFFKSPLKIPAIIITTKYDFI